MVPFIPVVILLSILFLSPVSILYKSIAGRYRPVSYPDGPITARYRLIKTASWEGAANFAIGGQLCPQNARNTTIVSINFVFCFVRN